MDRRQSDENLIKIFESLAELHTKQDAFSEKQDAFRSELLAEGGRIPQVEEDVKDLKNKLYGVVVTALTGLIASVGFFIKHYVLKGQ